MDEIYQHPLYTRQNTTFERRNIGIFIGESLYISMYSRLKLSKIT